MADMINPRYINGICNIGNHIYVIGGYDCNKVLPTCERFDVLTNNWSELTSCKLDREQYGVTTQAIATRFIFGFGGNSLHHKLDRKVERVLKLDT